MKRGEIMAERGYQAEFMKQHQKQSAFTSIMNRIRPALPANSTLIDGGFAVPTGIINDLDGKEIWAEIIITVKPTADSANQKAYNPAAAHQAYINKISEQAARTTARKLRRSQKQEDERKAIRDRVRQARIISKYVKEEMPVNTPFLASDFYHILEELPPANNPWEMNAVLNLVMEEQMPNFSCYIREGKKRYIKNEE